MTLNRHSMVASIRMLMAALRQLARPARRPGCLHLSAPRLVHSYFEMIHLFWDGNGRAGRVFEAAILHAEGFRYAPFALARYYLADQIDRYFALFNLCRNKPSAAICLQTRPSCNFISKDVVGSPQPT